MQTEIGFYHLSAAPLERTLPRLLEKMLEKGHRVVVLGESEERVEALNHSFWTYHPQRFLPHGSARDGFAEEQPIYLSVMEENSNKADALVVTDGRTPESIAAYARLVDMFDGTDAAQLQSARQRWKQYKEQGHPLTYWKQNDKGAWEKGA
jgi:DNA polymerase-3 subunit chi